MTPYAPLVRHCMGIPTREGHGKNIVLRVTKFRFIQVHEGWPSCYLCDDARCMLVIYVDDFKPAGPA